MAFASTDASRIQYESAARVAKVVRTQFRCRMIARLKRLVEKREDFIDEELGDG